MRSEMPALINRGKVRTLIACVALSEGEPSSFNMAVFASMILPFVSIVTIPKGAVSTTERKRSSLFSKASSMRLCSVTSRTIA